MIKQNLSLGAIILALGLFFGNTPVFADEVEVDCLATPEDAACIELINDEEADHPIAEPTDDNEDDTPVRDHDYPEADADTTGDEEVEITEEEEEAEPALWPMYVSLGALGVAILVFIILNLFGGKKK